MAKYLSARTINIKGIIDNHCFGAEKEGFNIISFDEVDDGAKILITAGQKTSNESILRQIAGIHKKTKVIRFQDLYDDVMKSKR